MCVWAIKCLSSQSSASWKSKRGNLRSINALLVILAASTSCVGNCWARDMPLNKVLNCSLDRRVPLTGPAKGEQMAHRPFNLQAVEFSRIVSYEPLLAAVLPEAIRCMHVREVQVMNSN